MQTLHYQLSVIDLSFLSVEKLLVDGIMMFPELQSARQDKICGHQFLVSKELSREQF